MVLDGGIPNLLLKIPYGVSWETIHRWYFLRAEGFLDPNFEDDMSKKRSTTDYTDGQRVKHIHSLDV